ncbi:hypothetical protein HELRODRAFT_167280 [Helobdella robusta]|uniref:DH domain-containing protein n=1 Tax=Helobdella robusta TaxID=6412 RepID=T1EZ79_HELRO|nr:hypothetical protein HELRODRAFT_167280 [Helobdella robusta]ESO10781.1 hypothetical protein HELRODRAFT_167280 [Helobdella robusta]
MGRVVLSLADNFKLYPPYAVNYQKIIETFDELVQNDSKFRRFVEHFEKSNESMGLKLKHLFIEPIQRLPRYELLLKEYISCLDESMEDYKYAKDALEKIVQFNRRSNEGIRQEENVSKVKQIMTIVVNIGNLMAPGRSYVMEADANIIQPITGKIVARKLYLFNDMLIVCNNKSSYKDKKALYEAVHKIPLSILRYRAVAGRLYLISPMAMVEFVPKNTEELQSWIKLFACFLFFLHKISKNNLEQSRSRTMSDHEACLVKVKNNVQFFESVIAASMSNENNVEAKELYASNLKRNIEKLKLMKFQFDNNSNDVCANKNSKNNCNNNGFTERKITCGNVTALNEGPSKSSNNKINFPNFSSYSTKNSILVLPTTATANDDNPNIETVSSPSVAVLKAKLESHQSFQDSLLYSSLTVPRKRLDRNANNNNGGSNLVLRESSMYNSSAGIVRKGHFIKEISEDDININDVNDINNSKDVSTTTSTTTTLANSDQMKINKMDKKAAKLDKVQQEFVHTETRYVKRLAALCENFQKQVIAYNTTALPYQYAPLDKLFPDITKIYKFHVNKLLPGLKESTRLFLPHYTTTHSLPKKLLGQLFVDLEFDFQVYEHYPAAYKECLSVLEKCVTHYQGFAPVVFDFEERLEISEGLKLKYFFIEPIQRLPRYELLLKVALNLIKQLNLLWNANIKKQENYFKMKEIEDKIVDSIDLISSPREIVKEGVVDVIQPTGIQEKYIYLVGFFNA